MIRKIVLENFMAHKRTVIEPAEGLTVLTGPNNCGKSAVVVALQALCENDRSSKTFVRHGEKEARVVVETSEGHKIEWIRGREVSYRIDGREVHRLRGETPEDLHEKLRLPQVEDPRGDKVDVHFAEQKDPIFLVNDRSGAKAARFFSAASDAALLLKMQQLHKDRVRDATRDERRLVLEIDEAKRDLERLEGLTTLEEKCSQAEKQYDHLTGSLASAEHLYALREAINEKQVLASKQDDHGKALERLEPPPTLEDEASLAWLSDHIVRRQADLQRASARGKTLRDLTGAPALEDEVALASVLHELERKRRCAQGLSDKTKLTANVQPPPNLLDSKSLAADIAGLQAHLVAVANGHELLASIDAELARALREIEVFIAENPTCPLCGSTITPENLLHTHHEARTMNHEVGSA